MSVRGRVVARGVAVATVGVLVVSMLAPAARAEVTVTVVDGVLTIASDDAGDDVRVRCQGGDVTVNEAEPASGAASCASIVAIDFSGGAGDDAIDLSRLSAESFTALTSTTLNAGAGNDRITGSVFADAIAAGPGNDRVDPGGGTDAIVGGKGDDALSLRASGELDLSDEQLTHPGGSATLAGIDSAQVQAADLAVAVVFDASAFSGPVTLSGSGMDDVLVGGAEADRLSGGDGVDVLKGGAGDDLLDPGAGTGQKVLGGKGTDTLTLALDGAVTVRDGSVSGAVGADLSRVELVRASGGDGNDRIDSRGFSGVATLQGGDGNDVLIAGDGDDLVSGGPGDDRLTGGDGDDRISGEDGDDRLRGGAGDDRLNGGPGRDSCAGGPGTNTLTSC
jgi:Ca2+-binding RTX toxin-like protein